MNDRYKILIVDDEMSIIAALTRILNCESYCILSTDSPEEAIKILQGNKIDVMVSDQRMPDITGLELLKYSKTISPGTVRILMTGYSDIGVAISLINEGDVFYYISKPWDNEDIRSIIKRAVEYRCEQDKKEKMLNAAVSYSNNWSNLIERMKTQLAVFNRQSMNALANVIKAKDISLFNHSERTLYRAL